VKMAISFLRAKDIHGVHYASPFHFCLGGNPSLPRTGARSGGIREKSRAFSPEPARSSDFRAIFGSMLLLHPCDDIPFFTTLSTSEIKKRKL
jgi:hypothetical protein